MIPLLPRKVLTVMFGIVGLMVFEWGIRAVVNRRRALTSFRDKPGVMVFINLWTAVTFAAGSSMIAGAIVIWMNWRTALLLALWPAAVATLLNLMKISNFSFRRIRR